MIIFSLLDVFSNAEKLLLAHTLSKKRLQREHVLAAIAANEAEVAASQERPRPQPFDAQLSNAVGVKKPKPKETKRPDLRGEIFEADGDIPQQKSSVKDAKTESTTQVGLGVVI